MFFFQEVSKYQICPIGSYKIAIALDNIGNNDFHFYRQNIDGSWSHKLGKLEITDKDFQNNIIFDPETCERETGDLFQYTEFVGFYAVTPWGYIYEEE